MSRYIDAEILLDAMRHITLGETDVARSEMKIVHYICHMPHIDDVRENVRGEWIKHNIYHGSIPWGHDCSVCGHWFVVGEEKIKDYKFCPNCGADMRPISALSENVEIVSNLKRGES